jgi:uncharacterized membrane protein
VSEEGSEHGDAKKQAAEEDPTTPDPTGGFVLAIGHAAIQGNGGLPARMGF